MKKNQIGQAILRVMLGFIFFIHGVDKFRGGINYIVEYFESLGIPGFMAYVVAIIELVGGIALILGIGTRIVAILTALIMVGAIFTAKLSLGLLGVDGMAGYELDLALLAISIYLILARKIYISLDALMFKKQENN